MTRFCMSLYVYEFSPGVRGSGYITNQNGETISFWFLNNNIFLSIFYRNEFIFLVLETMSEITVFVFVRERKVGVTN